MVSISSSRRVRLGLIVACTALAFGVIPASATLTGSTFEDNDGNLVLDGGSSSHDWNAPIQAISCPTAASILTPAAGVGTNCGRDITDPKADNAFGQGAKEDISNPSEVTGSIPPNKSNLTRFYVNTEKTSNNHDLLYLAFERSNVLGSANMDFELNQNAVTPTGKVTPLRTEGDILITFDFTNGGSKPDLGILFWRTNDGTNTAAQCFANNALPCWGDRAVLGSTQAEGQVYKDESATTFDANAPTVNLPAFTFGEAGIDLQAAGVFEGCQHFGAAFLKSRSSASFPAELKDFIAPIPVNIANCGSLAVQKYIDINENGANNTGETTLVKNGGTILNSDLTGWSFTITGPSSFSCTGTTLESGALGDCVKADTTVADLAALAPGTYTVTENANTGKKIGDSPGADFINVDPGSDNTNGGTASGAGNAPVSETVSVGVSGSSSVDFGNSCYATVKFEVDSVPSGQSGLFVRYTLQSEANLIDHDVNLTLKSGTTNDYVASAGGLRRGESVSWKYGINHGTGTEQTKSVITAIPLGGYPACSGSGTVNFASSTITGTKYKDMDADGVKDAGEGGLQGFAFQLKSGATLLDTQRSGSTGTYSFTGIAPGTYTIHEVTPPTGWQQTEPASSGDETVTVSLGDGTVTTDSGGNPIRFGNTPQSTVRVVFSSTAKLLNADGTESATAATKVDPANPIACKDKDNATLALTGGTASDKTTGQLLLSQSAVTCTVTFIDP